MDPEKPLDTNIQLDRTDQYLIIRIPAEGLSVLVLMLLLGIAICTTGLVSEVSLSTEANNGLPLVILTFMDLAAISIALYLVYGTIELRVDADRIILRHVLFGLARRRIRKTQDWKLTRRTIVQEYNEDEGDEPDWAIELLFDPGTEMDFGRMLSEEEQVWLTAELEDIRKEFQGRV